MTLFDDKWFMQQALAEAQKAFDKGEVPVGAVVVSDNRIIARAHNQTEQLCDATAHAEMIALTAACNSLGHKYLPDCTLYVTLEPCAMCAGALYWSQLGKLVYGAGDEKRGYGRVKEGLLHPRTVVVADILREECEALVKGFFERLRE